ncbi:hypothetical protein LTR84_003813 [Exophiala bonariae]|uniref:BNR repeat-containing family member n=1 Tax=Exophiala bonariae TaxID=1690606 RepID=A0AAV9N6D6_9EURO|nr:hypothetical protein LTR84_003813 [Exophiala bonariae]
MFIHFAKLTSGCFLLSSLVQATVSPGALETISAAVDANSVAAFWSPLAEAGGYTWLAYNRNPMSGNDNGHHNVMVVRRGIDNGVISRDCLKASDGQCATFLDDAGHNTPSLAVDGDGYVHVFAAMHNEAWHYYRSSQPYSPSQMTSHSSEMPDSSLLITYPVIKSDSSGNLWLIIRGDNGNGVARGGYLYKYTLSSKTWARIARFAYDADTAVYPDDITFDASGNLHIIFEWSKNPASAIRHQGSYLRYSPTTNTWSVANGDTVSVPVTRSTPQLVFQPLTAGEQYDTIGVNDTAAPAFQSAKLALYESSGIVRMQAAYRYKAAVGGVWQVRRAYATFGDTAGWTREILFSDTDTSAAIDITHDGTSVRVYYCKIQDSVYVREKVGNAAWTETALAAGKGVQRLSVSMRADGTDVTYLVAPKNVNSTTGSLYLQLVGGR